MAGGGDAVAGGDDARLMRRALELAEQGWGRVHPNPLVGAVVVRGGEIIGEGAHREFGGAHAEVEALEAAGPAARGANLYVTLEPCAHAGKTPPCTDAIARAGIARLVYAAEDPHPEAGGGAAQLRDAGVEVRGGVERAAARTQNAPFLVPIERGRPFVALKYALSLDARLAAAEGRRTRVTGREAETEVHRLRSGYDAILIGASTARVDDPRLTVREAPPPRVAPARVVADPRATLPPTGQLARTAREIPTWIITGDDVPPDRVRDLERAGVRILRCPTTGGLLDPVAIMARLFEESVRTVFCEGGGRLGGALLEADLVDRLHLIYAPVVYGERGVPAFPLGEETAGHRGRRSGIRSLGEDTMLTVELRD